MLLRTSSIPSDHRTHASPPLRPLPSALIPRNRLPAGREAGSFRIENELPTTLRQAPPDSLRDAASHLRACLRADGSSDGSDDFERPEKEWAALRVWAETRGLILSASFPPPERDGGREHDVRYDATTGLWWKYTKPNLAGYTVSWTDGKPWLHNTLPSVHHSEHRCSLRLHNFWKGLKCLHAPP